MLIPILGWCVIGYAGGWMAARKGYPPVLGVVVGIVFGPVALAVAALLPATNEGRAQQALDRDLLSEEIEMNRRRNCPSCHREISARASVCGLCGNKFA